MNRGMMIIRLRTIADVPIGLQIIAKPFDEPSLFRAAYAYEQATDWHKQHPEL